jgi:hypothetical protein
MPKQLIGEEIAKARQILAIQPLPTEHHDNLQAQLCDLELHLQSHEPIDYERFSNLLRAVEAEIDVEHPIVASVISTIIRTLGSMGI